MHIPRLDKNHMMARLHDSRIEIKIEDILICSGVSKEDSREVVSIELASTRTRMFHTDSGTKKLEVGDIWFTAAPRLVWGLPNGRVHELIMEIRHVYQSRGPKFCWETGAIEERSHPDRKGIVIYLDSTVLGGAIRASGFADIVEFL